MCANDLSTDMPTIAVSARWHTFPQRFEWLADHGFALEYTPDPDNLELIPEHGAWCADRGVPIRYHVFFPDHEFGHADAELAEANLARQMRMLALLPGAGERVATAHIGLRPATPLDLGRCEANLVRLAEHARCLGVTLCLENLRRGPTSDPATVLAWATSAGTRITLDVGHAVSCEAVKQGERTVDDYIDVFSDRLVEVHMYEREEDRHYAPRDMTILGPIVDRLFGTGCRWWTIELEDLHEALSTRALLLEYVAQLGSW